MIENLELIQKLRSERKTYSEIGLQLGVSKQRIQQVCRKYNIQKALPMARASYLERKKEKFLNRVSIGVNEVCWPWKGSLSTAGYGILSFYGHRTYAHRVSYLLFKDPNFKLFQNGRNTENSLHVLHSCDNPNCVNPNHLRLGTPGENMRDRDSKGRNRFQRSREASLI